MAFFSYITTAAVSFMAAGLLLFPSLAAVKLNGPLITLTALFIAATLLFFQQKNSREAK